MPLTLFMAICILGCDVLIYFLFQWTLGEKGRTRKRRCGAKRRVASEQESQLFIVPASKKTPVQRAKILQYGKYVPKKASLPEHECEPASQMDEETVYRRRAAAFAASK